MIGIRVSIISDADIGVDDAVECHGRCFQAGTLIV